jgi:hypothetical protein
MVAYCCSTLEAAADPPLLLVDDETAEKVASVLAVFRPL